MVKKKNVVKVSIRGWDGVLSVKTKEGGVKYKQTFQICLGNMIKPRTWFDPEGTDGNHRGCGILDGLPHHTEFEEETGNKPDCMNFW